ncbi:F-box/LRR-repeat protein 14, partial [Biomphalaria pfeifferi]
LELLSLPMEVLIKITKMLTQKEMIQLAKTCKSLKRIVYSKEFWSSTQVFMNLLDDTSDYKIIYSSLNARGLYSLYFFVSSYHVLIKHLYLIRYFWPKLTLLCDLTKNRVTEVVDELKDIPPVRLRNLCTFVSAKINRQTFNTFQHVLHSISYLSISSSSCDDNIAHKLVKCKNFKVLNLSRTLVTNLGVKRLCGFRRTKCGVTYDIEESLFNLEIIDISNNMYLNEKCWKFLKGLDNLKILTISVIDEICPGVESFKEILNIKFLTSLNIDSANSPEGIMLALSAIESKLKALSFKSCQLRDCALLTLESPTGFKSISCLKISSEVLTDNGIFSVCDHLKQLVILDISDCINLTDICLVNITNRLEKRRLLCVIGCTKMTVSQLDKKRQESKDCVIQSDFDLKMPDLGKIADEELREVFFYYHFLNDSLYLTPNFRKNVL